MNHNFTELPEEKQLRIINSAMEVFSKYEYKKASTDDIAAKAGISKGLLFYYFHNKKSLYLYVYKYMTERIQEQVLDAGFWEITDFFELMEYCAVAKLSVIEKNPYIMDFAMRSFYPESEAISDDLNAYNQEFMAAVPTNYFQNIDLGKFRDGVDPAYILRMLSWMADGYLHEKRALKQPLLLPEMMEEFKRWMNMLRPLIYKEEFL